MTWTTSIIFGLIMTGVTGGMLFLAWSICGKLLDKLGLTNILYYFLKCECVFFLLPIAYGTVKQMDYQMSLFGGVIAFERTPSIVAFSRIIMFVWAIGLVISLLMLCKSYYTHSRIYKSAFDCSLEFQEAFRNACWEIGVNSKRIRLIQSYMVEVPFITGFIHTKIVLPVNSYEQEELRVIFLHELMHYKQRDHQIKYLIKIILCVQWFNPLAWLYSGEFDRWSEYACDYFVIKKFHHAKRYFEIIINMIKKDFRWRDRFSSSLFEEKRGMEKRIEKIKINQNKRSVSAKKAMIVIAMMCVISIVGVIEGTACVVKAYQSLVDSTQVMIEEQQEETTYYEEYIDETWEEGVVEEIGYIQQTAKGTSFFFDWYVNHNTATYTTSFYVPDQSEIIVGFTMDPANQTVSIGIQEEGGSKRYIRASDRGSHSFSIRQGGNYQVFVKNTSGKTVQVSGHVSIR